MEIPPLYKFLVVPMLFSHKLYSSFVPKTRHGISKILLVLSMNLTTSERGGTAGTGGLNQTDNPLTKCGKSGRIGQIENGTHRPLGAAWAFSCVMAEAVFSLPCGNLGFAGHERAGIKFFLILFLSRKSMKEGSLWNNCCKPC